MRKIVAIVIIGLVVFCAGSYGLGMIFQHDHDRFVPVPIEEVRAAAVREAAHAVVGLAIDPDYPLRGIGIIDKSVPGGAISETWYTEAPDLSTPGNRLAEAAARLAGDVAEGIVLGRTLQTQGNGNNSAREACRPPCLNREGDCVDIDTGHCLERARRLAEKLVRDNKFVITSLAERLMDQSPEGYVQERSFNQWAVKKFIKDARVQDAP